MPNHRLPLAKAEASGAALKNPGRFKGRAVKGSVRALGEPYVRMSEVERGYWAEFASELPWLHSGHRVLLRLTCQFAARMDSGDEIGVSAAQALSSMLSKLGATPVDESKVTHGDDDGGDDLAESFFARAH